MKKFIVVILISVFLYAVLIPAVNAQPAIGKLYSERMYDGAMKKNGHRLWNVGSNSSSPVKKGPKRAKARSNSNDANKGASAPTMSMGFKGRSNSSVKGSVGYGGTKSYSKSPNKNASAPTMSRRFKGRSNSSVKN